MSISNENQETRLIEVLIYLTGQALFLGITRSVLYVAGNTLFLANYGADAIAYVYIAVGFVVSFVFFGYSGLQKKWALPRLAFVSFTGLTLSTFALWLALKFSVAPGFSFALLIFDTLLRQISMVILGEQAGQLLDVRQLKRYYPFIRSGWITGLILTGLATAPLISFFNGIENLVLLAGFGILATFVLLLATLKRFHSVLGQERQDQRNQPTKPLPQLFKKKYVSRLFSYQILSVIGSQLLIYLFLKQALIQFPDPEAFAGFMGGFVAFRNILSFLFLLMLAGWLLNRFGLGFGLVANPVGVGLMIAATVMFAQFFGTAGNAFFYLVLVAFVVDIVLTDGVTETAIKAAYQALRPQNQSAVTTAVEGVGVPVAFGMAGVLLLIFNQIPQLTLVHIIFLTLFVTIIWTFLGVTTFREYVSELGKNIRWHLLPDTTFVYQDQQTLAYIKSFLAKDDDLFAIKLGLDILAQSESDYEDVVIDLIDHPDPQIQVEALRRVERAGILKAYDFVKRKELSDDSDVQAQAIRTVMALMGPEGIAEISHHLHHPVSEVRQQALVGLLRYGSILGIIKASTHLKDLEQSPNESNRVFMSQVIGDVQIKNFYHPLLALLKDPSVVVRHAAARAASHVRHPGLISSLVPHLDNRRTRSAAMGALIAMGADILPTVERALEGTASYSKKETVYLLRACRHIQSPGTVALLKKYLLHPDQTTQLQVMHVLRSHGYSPDPEESEIVEGIINEYVKQAVLNLQILTRLDDHEAIKPLQRALEETYKQIIQVIFLLFSLLFDTSTIVKSEKKLEQNNPRERALALETLDVMLPARYKAFLIPLVNHALSNEQKLKQLSKYILPEELSQVACLEHLANGTIAWSQGWVQACALHAIAHLGHTALHNQLSPALQSPIPFVQETAVYAAHMLAPTNTEDILASLQTNDNPVVSQIVTAVRDGAAPGAYKNMLIIEKALLLKKTKIFAHTPEHVLTALAQFLVEVELEPGETFIRKGDTSDCMYVIVRGKVKIHSEGRQLFEMKIGDTVGELGILDPQPRSADATAVEETFLFRIDKDAFDEVIDDQPEIAHSIIQMLAQRLREQGSFNT